jgi:lipid II:glycine glycyltransferase (peptidoglycan interpeptide bridge formation enzyme)
MVAELNIEKYKDSIKEELEMYKEKKAKTHDNRANSGKIQEFQNNIELLQKRIDQADEIKKSEGNVVTLAGGMFMTYGNEVVYLFSGSRGEYLSFGGQYFVQWDMIKYGIKNGYKLYNFYGISGDFSNENKRHGLYEFKKSFGGTVIEYIGDFDLIISKPLYWFHELLRKAKRK